MEKLVQSCYTQRFEEHVWLCSKWTIGPLTIGKSQLTYHSWSVDSQLHLCRKAHWNRSLVAFATSSYYQQLQHISMIRKDSVKLSQLQSSLENSSIFLKRNACTLRLVIPSRCGQKNPRGVSFDAQLGLDAQLGCFQKKGVSQNGWFIELIMGKPY